ncbi:Gfo/Idh/MocA family protein [Phocaeicola coprophilus]|jgi:predicted dehydrogenase|uniref:Oxidoreductase, NAD-binding domain protein n=2 Tax=Phocaeicola coprophilus TaxID=387090 RepID=S0F820_9BACT|nr:Gfo/Idh/MocA family oxidoreductase [Phocaeicola coprophilus]EEF74686.1 oxidoreductase, NAD-binding domain protein [Phocaeicola coprophilus DSM 18228 = JCM 13818]QRO24037.1 Gfo/Idh/MocA family oxidoreductase [Phocaeicola coprophilus]RHA74006.1 gfo/Idh/MocA family oxidoreductase [Phocaeicola coprophilus]
MKGIKTVLIGAGYRGQRLLRLMQGIEAYNVTAVFDPAAVFHTDGMLEVYTEGPEDYKRMIAVQHPELVVIASPWHFHVEQALYALEQGCHVAMEIKGGFCLGEYDPLIEVASRKGLRIYPLENAVFTRENMAMLQLVQAGVLGQLVALRGGYRHDLRDMLVDEQGNLGNPNKPEGIWRSRFYLTENGDLYPTHGLAPLCLAAGVGRTDRIAELTSFSSRACGLNEFVAHRGGTSPLPVSMGDIVITQMRTEAGVLITLTHDTTLPRPRSLDFELQGSKGIWRGEFRQIYVEGESPYETWEDDEKYIARYEHICWQKWGKEALIQDVHHQGMDYIMLRMLAADFRGEMTYPITAGDLALWTSVSPYSKLSIAGKRTVFL